MLFTSLVWFISRVPCNYGSTTIAFKIDPMTNAYWLAMAVEFCEGDGGLSSVEVSANGSQQFKWMQNIWGAVWAAHVDPSFHGPYTIRLISRNNEPVVAFNAIPYGFAPGQKYYSHINFRS